MLRSAVRLGPKSRAIIAEEAKYGARNYAPLPVVFAKASKSTVVSPDGTRYLDFLAGYGAVSQGHLHPRLIRAVTKQLHRCTLSSRAFYSDKFGDYAKYITKITGYDRVLPMNTGAEGVETALKLARKWGYKVKGIKNNKAKIVCCTGNFHGRTFGAIAMSTDPASYANYGPQLPGFIKVKYGDADRLEAVFKKHHKKIAGFICEPIQGEAGVIIPPAGYLRKVRRLCTKYNILYIDDEVQAGLGRTGKMLAVEHERVRPDVIILAKALGGGVMPVAAVLADSKHMVFEPGTHGSTFGGSPLSAALAQESLRVLKEEKMPQRAARAGKILAAGLEALKRDFPFIKETRCRGLFSAIEMKKSFLGGVSANRLMHIAKEHGVLSKVTHGTTLRITPPLVITDRELKKGLTALRRALRQLWLEADPQALQKAESRQTLMPAVAGTKKTKAAVKRMKTAAKNRRGARKNKSAVKKTAKKAAKRVRGAVRRVKKAATGKKR